MTRFIILDEGELALDSMAFDSFNFTLLEGFIFAQNSSVTINNLNFSSCNFDHHFLHIINCNVSSDALNIKNCVFFNASFIFNDFFELARKLPRALNFQNLILQNCLQENTTLGGLFLYSDPLNVTATNFSFINCEFFNVSSSKKILKY